jgi:hypothetical protein
VISEIHDNDFHDMLEFAIQLWPPPMKSATGRTMKQGRNHHGSN